MSTPHLVILGAEKTYKTYMCQRMASHLQEDDRYEATVYVNVISPPQLNYQLWDVAGQPGFAGVRDGYFNTARGVLLMARSDQLQTLDALCQEHQFIGQKYPHLPVKALVVKRHDQQMTLPLEDLKARLPAGLTTHFCDIDTIPLDNLVQLIEN